MLPYYDLIVIYTVPQKLEEINSKHLVVANLNPTFGLRDTETIFRKTTQVESREK